MEVPIIKPPANPFWRVFRTFGRDELTGALIALIATACLEATLHAAGGLEVSPGGSVVIGPGGGLKIVGYVTWQVVALALAGPIFEKIGFFFWHFRDAYRIYHSTPALYRESRGHYIKQAFQGGMKTLLMDLLIHDPLYVGLMMLGMYAYPVTPAWLLVPLAFGLAVMIVATLEVGFQEVRYATFKWRLQYDSECPFDGVERYLDARFYLGKVDDVEAVIKALQSRFLPQTTPEIWFYEDNYFDAQLPEFNGREGILRARQRHQEPSDKQGSGPVTTLQYVYSRITENGRQVAGQFRCFPRQKDKIYRMYYGVDGIERAKDKGQRSNGAKKCISVVKFKRYLLRKQDKIYIAVDQFENRSCVIEVKVYPAQIELLIEAMHFVMHRFPALQTTRNKTELLGAEVMGTSDGY